MGRCSRTVIACASTDLSAARQALERLVPLPHLPSCTAHPVPPEAAWEEGGRDGLQTPITDLNAIEALKKKKPTFVVILEYAESETRGIRIVTKDKICKMCTMCKMCKRQPSR